MTFETPSQQTGLKCQICSTRTRVPFPTIFALSSGPLPAGLAVVRISGSQAGVALQALTSRILPQPRYAALRRLHNPVSGELLDQALVLWMPGPQTATGDDMVELHLHGGRAVLSGVLAALGEMAGLCAAEAGDFTRRAFENGRIDLSQVEGLADLLVAETAAQRRSALVLAEGRLGALAEGWRATLLGIAAQAEALLDHGDEEDVPQALDLAALAALTQAVMRWNDAPSAERLRDGVRIVLAGPPNAGKSTLLNALAQREAAITSPIAGTTRDIVEVPVMIGGLPIVFSDTAGLRDARDDAVEQDGVRRAQAAVARADIILWLGAVGDCPDHARSILIAARADTPGRAAPEKSQVSISALTGEGMALLHAQIAQRVRLLLPVADGFAINQRQREAIRAIGDALAEAHAATDLVIAAEHLRLARTQMDRLVGRAGVEDMLDALFGAFCIGK